MSFLVLQSSGRGGGSWCFALLVFRMSHYCKCSVAFLHGAVGWSAVCDCGISWSYSLICRFLIEIRSKLVAFYVEFAAPFLD